MVVNDFNILGISLAPAKTYAPLVVDTNAPLSASASLQLFKPLETLEYRWIDVLPRLLSENPAERPTNLSELVETSRSAPAAEPEKADEPPRRKRRVLFALAGAAAVVAAVAGYFLFSHLSAPAAADENNSWVQQEKTHPRMICCVLTP